MKNYLLSRLKEPSTWRGIVLLATSSGIALSPQQSYAITALGLALAGGIGASTPDGNR